MFSEILYGVLNYGSLVIISTSVSLESYENSYSGCPKGINLVQIFLLY